MQITIFDCSLMNEKFELYKYLYSNVLQYDYCSYFIKPYNIRLPIILKINSLVPKYSRVSYITNIYFYFLFVILFINASFASISNTFLLPIDTYLSYHFL